MVDTKDLKSFGHCGCAGSSPAPSTKPTSLGWLFLRPAAREHPQNTSDSRHYPFKLPSGWVWTTLGEISNYGLCSNIPVTEIDNNSWVLELEDLEKDSAKILKTILRGNREINGVRHKFRKGEILYSKLRTYLNKVLVAPNDGFCTTEIIPFNAFADISNQYICHVLRSEYFLSYTHQCGYGVKMPRLSTGDACKALIPLPPINEQIKIVQAIDCYFNLIEYIENDSKCLSIAVKQAKNKILDLAIHGKLVPQDPADEPASELLKRVNPSAEITCDIEHYPHLPNGWCIVPMKLLCSLEDGRKEENIERFNIDVKFLRGEREAKSINNGRYVAANSLLILVDGENSGEVFRTPIEGYQGSTFKRLVINENMCEEYLLNVISSHRKVLRENKVGSAIPHLNKKLFKEIEVPIPPVNEQRRIVSAINTLFNYIDNIAENL